MSIRLKDCTLCGCGFYVKEIYGLNDSDEYIKQELGHSSDCLFSNIDPIMRRYISDEDIKNWKPFDVNKVLSKEEGKPIRTRQVMYTDNTTSIEEY